MAQIKINFSGVSAANAALRKTLQRMNRMEAELAELCGSVDPEIKSKNQVRGQLNSCRNEADILCTKTKKLCTVVENGAENYRSTESRLLRNTPDHR